MDVVTLALALKKSKAYTDEAIAAVASGMIYKGSVATVADLPEASSSNKGWIYTVTANGHEHVSDGTQWVDLSADLDNKLDISQGTSHAGDFMVVGDDGNITTRTLDAWTGGNY